ncbi:MAG: helix-turn-helix transcriptional regulator [Alphaproteobacteria bacterium]|nr:helix-turn-helix transcriptional regulator [Alphaproteobacteria bacterium]
MATDRNTSITNNNAVDRHVGKRIRMRRTLMGMTQNQLAELLQLTFQQVQKYERGANRVSASRLWDLSQILDVEVGYFYEDMPPDIKSASPRQLARQVARRGQGAALPEWQGDPMARRETIELVRSYYLIKEPQLRKKMAHMIKSVASSLDQATDEKE